MRAATFSQPRSSIIACAMFRRWIACLAGASSTKLAKLRPARGRALRPGGPPFAVSITPLPRHAPPAVAIEQVGRPAAQRWWPCTQILVSSAGKKCYKLILPPPSIRPRPRFSRSGASFFGLAHSPAGSDRALSARSRYRRYYGKSGMVRSNKSQKRTFVRHISDAVPRRTF